MAPRRGGGDGGGGDSSSSSCDYDYPCTSGMHDVYGGLFSRDEALGQLVVYILFCLALLSLFSQSVRTKARWLQVAMILYLLSFILLAVRFGLIHAGTDVPIAYRYESSIVVLLQRLGIVFLFLAALPSSDIRIFTKMAFYPALGVLAVLNIAYLILDFLVSAKALDEFKQWWSWTVSDRDFGLTLTTGGLFRLVLNGEYPLSPWAVERFMYGRAFETQWHKQRNTQVKIGVAADFVALALALFVCAVAALPRIMRRSAEWGGSGTLYLLTAAFGLLLTTLFRVVVATHYVLHNWNIITDTERWLSWIDLYTFEDNGFSPTGLPEQTFLEGFRSTARGFPVVQAVLEPLGIVIACAALAAWCKARHKSQSH